VVGAKLTMTAICEGVVNLVEQTYAKAPEPLVALAAKSRLVVEFARRVIVEEGRARSGRTKPR
jgi:hypothetical protein